MLGERGTPVLPALSSSRKIAPLVYWDWMLDPVADWVFTVARVLPCGRIMKNHKHGACTLSCTWQQRCVKVHKIQEDTTRRYWKCTFFLCLGISWHAFSVNLTETKASSLKSRLLDNQNKSGSLLAGTVISYMEQWNYTWFNNFLRFESNL